MKINKFILITSIFILYAQEQIASQKSVSSKNVIERNFVDDAKNGKINQVKKAIQDGIDINVVDHEGNTALIAASRAGKKDVVAFLLNQPGIDVNKKFQNGRSALVVAVANKQGEIVSLLLTHPDIDVNLQDNNGDSALLIAFREKDLEMIQRFEPVFEKVNKKIINKAGQSLENEVLSMGKFLQQKLIEDVKKGDLKAVKKAFALGIDFNVADAEGNTPLIIVIRAGNVSIVEYLLAARHGLSAVDVNKKIKNGRSALLVAVANRKRDIVKLLLSDSYVDVNLQDNNGDTALMIAAREGFPAIVEMLLTEMEFLTTGYKSQKRKIDLDLKNNKGETALIIAQASGNKQIYNMISEAMEKKLLEKGKGKEKERGLSSEDSDSESESDKD